MLAKQTLINDDEGGRPKYQRDWMRMYLKFGVHVPSLKFARHGLYWLKVLETETGLERFIT